MKRFAAIAVAASMFALAACGEKQDPPPPTTNPPPSTENDRPQQPCTGPDGRLEQNCNIP